jgi:hypothetical protein
MLKKVIFYFFILIHFASSAQKNDSAMYRFKQAEEELKQLQKVVFYSRKEADRLEANKEFITVWKSIINDPKILSYPFDSLKDVSVLTPEDKKFKLITWDFHKDDGTFAYFGFLLVNNSKRIKKGFMHHETLNAYEAFQLIDRSSAVKSPESYIGFPDKWFGMLYTQIIACDGFYTLIGWDGNDKLTQRKFIDALYFKDDGTPVFGKDIFKFPRKNPKRLMFEYSNEVSMSLKFNERRNQIVYSHLSSREEGDVLAGQTQYYGPDGSFDALELKKDKWVTLEDVDARNKKNKNYKLDDMPRAEKPDTKKHKKLMPVSKTK